VGAVASTKLVTCAPDDDVRAALATMKQACVRRLPVVGFGGTVAGMLSMNDILRAAAKGKKGLANEDIMETLQAICAHHHPAPHIVAA
jgi:CBS domain-containing protein